MWKRKKRQNGNKSASELSSFLVRNVRTFLSLAISNWASDLLIWVISISHTGPSIWCHRNANKYKFVLFCESNIVPCIVPTSSIWPFSVWVLWINGNLLSIINQITISLVFLHLRLQFLGHFNWSLSEQQQKRDVCRKSNVYPHALKCSSKVPLFIIKYSKWPKSKWVICINIQTHISWIDWI